MGGFGDSCNILVLPLVRVFVVYLVRRALVCTTGEIVMGLASVVVPILRGGEHPTLTPLMFFGK